MALFPILLLALLGVAFAENVGSPVNTQNSQDVAAYWTTERMASAIPMTPQIFNQQQNFTKNQPDMLPVTFPGSEPANFPVGINITEPVAYPFPFTSGYAPTYTAYPWRCVGKVYFTQGTSNYVCSAGVSNQYLVTTAGHCVWSYQYGWSTNFIFVPGYNNGNYPYGYYYSYQLWVRSEYQGGNQAYDFANAVLQASGGYGIGTYVGWFGSAWGYPYTLSWRALGYPQEAPFDGQWNYYCDSALGVQDTNFYPNTIGIGCDATGGSSGGPWVYQFGSNNYINSVNSYKYTQPAQPLAMYGPYFGSEAYSLFQAASAVLPTCC